MSQEFLFITSQWSTLMNLPIFFNLTHYMTLDLWVRECSGFENPRTHYQYNENLQIFFWREWMHLYEILKRLGLFQKIHFLWIFPRVYYNLKQRRFQSRVIWKQLQHTSKRFLFSFRASHAIKGFAFENALSMIFVNQIFRSMYINWKMTKSSFISMSMSLNRQTRNYDSMWRIA